MPGGVKFLDSRAVHPAARRPACPSGEEVMRWQPGGQGEHQGNAALGG